MNSFSNSVRNGERRQLKILNGLESRYLDNDVSMGTWLMSRKLQLVV